MSSCLDYIQRTATSATTATHSVMGAALKAAVGVLADTGGRIFVIEGNCWMGEGSVSTHESPKTYGTTDEMGLYTSSPSEFFTSLTSEMLNHSITLSLIVAGSSSVYYNLASLEAMISDIGGMIYYSPTLSSPYRTQTLSEIHALIQVLTISPYYRSISGRLRLTSGLSVLAYHGGVTTDPNYNTFVCGGMSVDLSIGRELEMERYIKGPYVYAQFAIL